MKDQGLMPGYPTSELEKQYTPIKEQPKDYEMDGTQKFIVSVLKIGFLSVLAVCLTVISAVSIRSNGDVEAAKHYQSVVAEKVAAQIVEEKARAGMWRKK